MSDHQYLNPILGIPRIGAVLFTGAAFHIGFIDTGVRDDLPNPRTKLLQWANLNNRTTPFMGLLTIGTTAAALNAYRFSK